MSLSSSMVMPRDDQSVARSQGRRKKRGGRRDDRTAFRHFQEWLYRKHSLTFGMLVLFMILTGSVMVFLWWALNQWV